MSATGNQYFSKIENTLLAPSKIASQQVRGSLSSLKQVTGTCVPTAIGDYTIVDAQGEYITVDANSAILAVVLSSDIPLTSGGAATVTVGLTTAANGVLVAPIFLAAPATFGNVNQTVTSPANAGAAYVGSSNKFVTVETAGAVVTGGTVRATLLMF